jgi:hypothetical protein
MLGNAPLPQLDAQDHIQPKMRVQSFRALQTTGGSLHRRQVTLLRFRIEAIVAAYRPSPKPRKVATCVHGSGDFARDSDSADDEFSCHAFRKGTKSTQNALTSTPASCVTRRMLANYVDVENVLLRGVTARGDQYVFALCSARHIVCCDHYSVFACMPAPGMYNDMHH